VCPYIHEPVGGVNITASSNISFDRCTFESSGGSYALSISGGSQDVRVTRSRFASLSGGAAKLGNIDSQRTLSNDSSVWDSRMVFQQNTITEIATEFRGAAAVFAGYVANTHIDHNTIAGTG
jgi:hypothetical protein